MRIFRYVLGVLISPIITISLFSFIKWEWLDIAEAIPFDRMMIFLCTCSLIAAFTMGNYMLDNQLKNKNLLEE